MFQLNHKTEIEIKGIPIQWIHIHQNQSKKQYI